MKSIKINFTILLVCVFNLATAQTGNPPNEKWYRNIFGEETDIVNDVIPAQDGGYFVIGSTNSTKDDFKFCTSCSYGSDQAYIIKLDHQGKILWSKIILGATSQLTDYDSYLTQGVEVSDGFVAVGFMKRGSSPTDEFHIIKVNKFTGDLVWSRRIGDIKPYAYGGAPISIISTQEGFIVLAESSTNYKNAVLVRLSHEGTEIVRRTLEDFRLSAGCVLLFDNDETPRIGSASGKGFNPVVEYPLQKTADNNYIILGYKTNENVVDQCNCYDSDVRLMKISPNLSTIWDRSYGGNSQDYWRDMVIHPNGEIVILGGTCTNGPLPYGPANVNSGSWLMKLNSSGSLLDVQNTDRGLSISSFSPFGLGLTCDNKLALSGISYQGFVKYPGIQKLDWDLKTPIWTLNYPHVVFIDEFIFWDVTRDYSGNLIAHGSQNVWSSPDLLMWALQSECSSSGKCENALPIQCSQTLSGTTIGKTSEFGRADYSCLSSNSLFDGGDQVYVLDKNSGSGSLQISLVANTDLDIFLFDRCDATGLNCIGKSTEPRRPSGGNAELIRFDNLADGRYYIVVDGYRSAENGPFELTVTCGNLSCVSARSLTCNTPVTESNSNGVNNVSTYCGLTNTKGTLNGFAGRGKEKVYSFNIDAPQTVRIDLTGMSQGSDFDIYLLSECNPDKCVASSFNAGTTNELINIPLNPGLYYVVVESYYDRVGSYTLRVNCTTGGGSIPRPRIVLPTNLSVESGQDLSYPITASNFTSMAAMEFSLKLDDANILNIVGIEGKAINPAYNLASPSNIGISWFSQNQPTVTVPDGQVLFNVLLKARAVSGKTDISVTDVPTVPYALANRNGSLQTVSLDIGKGSVIINENFIQLCGNISKTDNSPVSDVILNVSGSKTESNSNQATGSYCFTSLPKGGNFTITPEKNKHLRNGINGRDLYLIQRHILGEKLTGPYRIIAADYDGNNAINGRDLYLTQRLILGDSIIPPVSSWRFVRKSQIFSDISNPFKEPLQTSIALNGVSQAQVGLDFIAMKVGDVDNSATLKDPILTSRGGTPLQLSLSKHNATQNSEVEVKLMARGFDNITSLDYTLQWDTTVIRFLRFEPPTNNFLGLSAGNFESTTSPGKLVSTWFDNGNGKSVPDGSVIARFIFKVVGQIGRSTPIQFVNSPVPLQAYTRTGLVQADTITGHVTVSTINATEGLTDYKINIFPNPVNDLLYIENVSEKTGVQFYLLDALGSEVMHIDLNKGDNMVKTGGLKSGIYFYRILSEGNSIVKSGKIVKH